MTSRRRLLHPPSTTPHLLTQLRAAAHARALTQNRYVCRRSPLAPGTAPASLPRTTENTATPLPKLPSSRHSRTVSLSARLSSSRLSLARSCSTRPRSRSSRATLPSLLTLQSHKVTFPYPRYTHTQPLHHKNIPYKTVTWFSFKTSLSRRVAISCFSFPSAFTRLALLCPCYRLFCTSVSQLCLKTAPRRKLLVLLYPS
uniref:Uncharacterized protein n=1 Tax=Setaria viridis TaxID=4556 RepID=A0A4U6UJ91_SETVI|nr:hypothetical protein SEVIR_5G283900v2 [Setaria viridis]